MLYLLVNLVVLRVRIRSCHRILLHFTDRELEDLGLSRGDVILR
ncbi:DUF1127 domain-containing protein [Methylobacterium persicinum]